MNNIVFRVDSSVAIGTGHVMRCLTLAGQLKKMGANISFICRELEGDLNNYIKESGYNVQPLSKVKTSESNNIFKWYKENWQQDVYETRFVIENQTYIVDVLIIDHYYGPNYVLIREEFIKAYPLKRNCNGIIQNILVFMGGSDPTNETIKVLDALALLEINTIVNVVVGSSNKIKGVIQEYCDRYSNFFFYCQVSNMAKLMNEADLIIGSGGTTTWERCYLGVPSITIIVSDNQEQLTNTVSKFLGTINLGFYHKTTSKHILQTVRELMMYPEKVKLISECASKLVNPKIIHAYPVANMIMEELR
ncbi:PseG/SpsG family protein [Alkalihalobacillus sp. BA299]|uniref:PseG/SpsG family protein n=1 Tax=Alkalihalobacillus sp. BA299 TaxID=2815938 RepID=UPI001ADA0CFD|nr:glycosyltransferase [Alkalihalobacillus sp. BA299]